MFTPPHLSLERMRVKDGGGFQVGEVFPKSPVCVLEQEWVWQTFPSSSFTMRSA